MDSNTHRLEGGRRTLGDARTEQPLVTIVIVVRNGKNDIEKALASVFAQSRDVCELIVIDGVSTDGTLDIIKKHSHNIDYWMSEPDNGIYDAMNKAVKIALGRYVYFLGCDDLLAVNLKALVSVLTDPSTIYYGDVRVPSGDIHPLSGPLNAWRLAKHCISQQSIFYPSAIFQTACFRTEYKIAGDYEFNLRCFGDKRLRFQYIPYVIAVYSETGISGQGSDPMFDRDRIRLIRRYLPAYIYLFHSSKQRLKRLIKRPAIAP